MLRIYDIKAQQWLVTSFEALMAPYTRFRGVSFVGSVAILENMLLPQFSQIEIILGMEDQKTGQNLAQIFDVARRSDELFQASSEFLDRIEAGSLQLKFTKDALFHSKYFILDNEAGDYAIINGSMNLTDKALHSNHEMIWVYQGRQADGLNHETIYADYEAIFAEDFEQHAVPYVDRKLIPQLRGKSREEMVAVMTGQVLADRDVIQLPQADIVAVSDSQTTQYLVEPQVVETVRAVYTPKGNKRRTESEKLAATIKTLHYKVPDYRLAQGAEENEAQDFARPIWLYDPAAQKLVVDGQQLAPTNASREDLITFVQVIKSYKDNKVSDESQQAMSAFLYLMTAPMIWKIRQIYQENGRNRDQVPITLALLGQGTSGKTMTIRDYFKKFIGDSSTLIGFETLGSPTARSINQNLTFMDNYLRSEIVSPLIIDEMREIFFSGKDAVRTIKTWSNDISGIHGVNIITSNTENVSVKPEIRKRIYYISITSRYKEMDQQVYDFVDLAGRLNDHLYKEVVYLLNESLKNLTEADIQRLLVDYMALTKDIVQSILKRHGLLYDLPAEVWDTYDFGTATFRKEWEIKLINDRYASVSFSPTNNRQFIISQGLFAGHGKFEASIQKEMQEFYNRLPAGVGIDLFSSGMTLDINAFDRFMGNEEIRKRYNEQFNLQQRVQMDDTLSFLQQQMAEQQALNKQLLDLQAKQLEQDQKKGLFKRWFGK